MVSFINVLDGLGDKFINNTVGVIGSCLLLSLTFESAANTHIIIISLDITSYLALQADFSVF